MGILHQLKSFAARFKGSSPYSASTAFAASPFADAFNKTRAPTAIELVRECLGLTYACATLNSDLVASSTLRLYVRTTARKQKSFLIERGDTRKLGRSELARLKRLKTVGNMAGAAEDVQEVLNHPALDLLQSPNDPLEDGVALSCYELFELTQRYLELVGRCYWYVPQTSVGGTPAEIWVLAPQFTQEVYGVGSGNRVIDHYTFSAGVGGQEYSTDEIIPFRCSDPNTGGYVGGWSPTRAAFEQVRIFRMFEAHTQSLLKNSGRPDAIWTPKGDTEGGGIGRAEAARMRDAFRQSFAMAGTGGVFVSEYPGALTPMNWPTRDVFDPEHFALIKSIVANCFSIPASKLDRNDANLASAQTGDYAHAKDAGLPRLRRMEAALNAFLVPMYDSSDQPQLFFAYDDPAGLKDADTEAENLKTAVAAGAVTRNEQRERLGLDPVDWGHQPLAPTGLVPVDPQNGIPVPTSPAAGVTPGPDGKPMRTVAVDETGNALHRPMGPDGHPVAPPKVAGEGDDDPNKRDDGEQHDPAKATRQSSAMRGADYRSTAGNSSAVMELQRAFYNGEITRDAAIHNAVLVFGFDPAEAEKLFPNHEPEHKKEEPDPLEIERIRADAKRKPAAAAGKSAVKIAGEANPSKGIHAHFGRPEGTDEHSLGRFADEIVASFGLGGNAAGKADEGDDGDGHWVTIGGNHVLVDGDEDKGGGKPSGRQQRATAGRLIHLIHEQGGFTYQPRLNEAPKTGKAVSIYPDAETAIPEKEMTRARVLKFLRDNAESFKDSRVHIGGWHDKDAGKIYLDKVVVVTSGEEAAKLSSEHNQEGYFDLDKGETVITKPKDQRRLSYVAVTLPDHHPLAKAIASGEVAAGDAIEIDTLEELGRYDTHEAAAEKLKTWAGVGCVLEVAQ